MEDRRAGGVTLTAEQLARLADLEAQIERFYAKPGNECGGSLHVVLDDGNYDRACIEFVLGYATECGDADGVAIATALLALSDDELEAGLGGSE